MSSIFSHNGIFTVQSVASGEHRTFRVRTQNKDSKFAPGERIISLLTGPNNTEDYKGFGFVKNDKIVLWKKHKGTIIEKLATMMENLKVHEERGHVKVMASTTCRKCNRELTTPESVLSGIGPICAGKDS